MKAKNQFVRVSLIALIASLWINISFAQPAFPQKTITVTPTQSIHFGTLSTFGSGGTVVVGWDGSRTSTGDIVLIPISPVAQPAIFEIKLCQGRNVIITFAATTQLIGSNGGFLTLEIGPTEKGVSGAIFATNNDCNYVTQLRVGGTLHVPGTAITGSYTGNLFITFNQE